MHRSARPIQNTPPPPTPYARSPCCIPVLISYVNGLSKSGDYVDRTCEIVASGVSAKMVAIATITNAAGAAAVVEAREARRGPVVAQGIAEWTTSAATTGAVAATLAEATDGGRTAREEVQRETASQPPPARYQPRARDRGSRPK